MLTNDLVQMTYGYSRDDARNFMSIYLEKGILKVDPFEVIDREGVVQLVLLGTERGRLSKSHHKVGIWGEHENEPRTVEFCHRAGMNYVSCSPFRAPSAGVAAAKAAIR